MKTNTKTNAQMLFAWLLIGLMLTSNLSLSQDIEPDGSIKIEPPFAPAWDNQQRLIGYVPTWKEGFDLSTLNFEKATHINVAFLEFDRKEGGAITDADYSSGEFRQMSLDRLDSLLPGLVQQAHAANTTISIAVGGAEDYGFLWLMEKYQNTALINDLADKIVAYVNQYNLDGVDLDLECWWADPNIPGTSDVGGRTRGTDKWGGNVEQGAHPAAYGMTLLAKYLRAKMPNKLISAAVFATPWYGNNYDAEVTNYLDWMGAMTYDFTGSWDASPLGPHSALYDVPENTYPKQSADNPIYSVQTSLRYWTGEWSTWQGSGQLIDINKMVIGVPFYGYDLSLTKKDAGQGTNGFYFIGYDEIVSLYPNAPTSYDPNDPHQLIGFVGSEDNRLIYFDTPKAVREKVKYAKEQGTQGSMVWEFTFDLPLHSEHSLQRAMYEELTGTPIDVNAPPTIGFVGLEDGQVIVQQNFETIPVTISVSDFDGTVSSSSITIEGVTTNGTSASFTPTAYKDYVISATATDNEGLSTTKSITITVSEEVVVVCPYPAWSCDATYTTEIVLHNDKKWKAKWWNQCDEPGASQWGPWEDLGPCEGNPQNTPPNVSITSPANGSTFTDLSTISITANATDTDGTISNVTFSVNGNSIATDNSAPYEVSWTATTDGTYTISATATDDDAATSSSSISITVDTGSGTNTPPSVSITSPTDGTTFTGLNLVNITASASDTDGSVTDASFSVDGNSLGTDTSAPYEASWTPTADGTYTISVIATDNEGASSSTSISVTVNTSTNNCSAPAWEAGSVYNGGDEVSHNGNSWRAKWWTQNEEPGTTGQWGVWEDLGPCTAAARNKTLLNFVKEKIIVYPNPAHNRTNIQFSLNESSPVKISIYSINGIEKNLIINRTFKAGNHSLNIRTDNFQKGMYIIRININGNYVSKRLLIK